MDHADHVSLLRAAVEPGGTWADIGAGRGAFTLALADLLGEGGRIVAVALEPVVADFMEALDLPLLDGLVAANSLHFVGRERQVEVIHGLSGNLRAGGRFVVIEYDADRGNPWVPHPFSQASWRRLAASAGLVEAHSIGRVPSRFLGAIYSAMAVRP
jgi:hypothetical protein